MASGLHLFYRWQVYDVRLGVTIRPTSYTDENSTT